MDLTTLIKTEEFINITSDTIESITDAFIKDDIMKDIPIVNTFYNIFKIVNKVSDTFFLKKLLLFLKEIETTPVYDRNLIISEIDKNGGKVGETILIHLNKIDSFDKATIIGKLFKGVINKQITNNEFRRICSMIDKVFIDDIEELRNYKNGENISYNTKTNLFICGFLTKKEAQNNIAIPTKGEDNKEFEINNYSEKLINIIYN